MSKLRIGELVGNHFDIIVSDCDVSPADAAKRAAAISRLTSRAAAGPITLARSDLAVRASHTPYAAGSLCFRGV